jgi:hypothetical protein
MPKKEPDRNNAWVVLGLQCKKCESDVKACDENNEYDFEWFCSNEECKNYEGTKTYDTQEPKWVELKRGYRDE